MKSFRISPKEFTFVEQVNARLVSVLIHALRLHGQLPAVRMHATRIARMPRMSHACNACHTHATHDTCIAHAWGTPVTRPALMAHLPLWVLQVQQTVWELLLAVCAVRFPHFGRAKLLHSIMRDVAKGRVYVCI